LSTVASTKFMATKHIDSKNMAPGKSAYCDEALNTPLNTYLPMATAAVSTHALAPNSYSRQHNQYSLPLSFSLAPAIFLIGHGVCERASERAYLALILRANHRGH